MSACECASIYAAGGGMVCGRCWEWWGMLPLTARTFPG
jgi:hypothetical protein